MQSIRIYMRPQSSAAVELHDSPSGRPLRSLRVAWTSSHVQQAHHDARTVLYPLLPLVQDLHRLCRLADELIVRARVGDRWRFERESPDARLAEMLDECEQGRL